MKNGRKERKGRKKESGLVQGAGLKSAFLDLALGQFAQAGQIIKDRSAKDTKGSDKLSSDLRALRDLRGEWNFSNPARLTTELPEAPRLLTRVVHL